MLFSACREFFVVVDEFSSRLLFGGKSRGVALLLTVAWRDFPRPEVFWWIIWPKSCRGLLFVYLV